MKDEKNENEETRRGGGSEGGRGGGDGKEAGEKRGKGEGGGREQGRTKPAQGFSSPHSPPLPLTPLYPPIPVISTPTTTLLLLLFFLPHHTHDPLNIKRNPPLFFSSLSPSLFLFPPPSFSDIKARHLRLLLAALTRSPPT